jgi:hypothetical protein
MNKNDGYNMKGPGDFDPPDEVEDDFDDWEQDLADVERGYYAVRFIESHNIEFAGRYLREFNVCGARWAVVKKDLQEDFMGWLHDVYLKEIV